MTARPSILFVDDDPDLLAGLRGALRRHARRWDLDFCTSGEQALGRLEQRRHDVIVSDVRMPGMDGVALLDRVRDRHPYVIRLVLSGQASQEDFARAMEVSHQFLHKPCPQPVLEEALTRACSAAARVDGPLRDVIGRLSSLPPVPGLCRELMESLSDPDVDLEGLAERVSTDPALVAKVFQLGRRQAGEEAPGVAAAVARVGVGGLCSVVLAAADTEERHGHARDVRQLPGLLSVHARRSATLAAELAAERGACAELAGTVALLQHVGVLILLDARPGDVAAAWSATRSSDGDLHVRLRQDVGEGTHGLAAALLDAWGLPAPIVAGVEQLSSEGPSAASPVACAVRTASALVARALAACDLEFNALLDVSAEVDAVEARWAERAAALADAPRRAAA